MSEHVSEFPSFLGPNSIPLHIRFIHLSVDGPLGRFHLLAIVTNAGLNVVGVQTLLQDPAFNYFGYTGSVQKISSHVA